jgi:uroporphyrinogen decarboxylase
LTTPFSKKITPDWESFYECISQRTVPQRVHYIELFQDIEVQTAICERYGLLKDLNPQDPFYLQRAQIALQSFLGYDTVTANVELLDLQAAFMKVVSTSDTADLKRESGRHFVDEHAGPITNWEQFEAFPWPDAAAGSTRVLEWFQENLPENMCLIAGLFSHFAEHLTWLMGYETLCIALFEQRDLVEAIARKTMDHFTKMMEKVLQFDRVKFVWGSDDMGFRGGPLISPADLREFVLPGHKKMARMAHDAGCIYLLHSCGQLSDIMEDLIEDVKIDAKHSYEDTILPVTEAHAKYGDRIAILGGIDVDFLCRADETQVRKRVRETLEQCMPKGGYCLGTGNSVANYIPLDNYLAMLDEGRRFTA